MAVLLCLTVLTLILSTPLVAGALIDRLQVFPALAPFRLKTIAAGPPSAIVILGAGRRSYAPEFGGEALDPLSLERVRYGAYVARQTGLPVLVSGGLGNANNASLAKLISDTLAADYGIHAQWLESHSRTTAENAMFSAAILRHQGIARIVLVTHAWHMKRAIAAFAANGLDVIPAPTGFYRTTRMSDPDEWLPSMSAFRMSGYAIHETVGSWWYALRYGY
jgi:uncharacterized SAM-binding protein YcdF (DUF218 family)